MKLDRSLHDEIKELWKKGLTGGQIVMCLGGHYTRSQILGMLHRAGLTGFREKPTSPKDRPAIGQKRPPKRLAARLVYTTVAKTDADRSFNGDLGPCSIMELNALKCHWPIGDPKHADFCYCAAPAIGKSSYCVAHHKLAHTNWWDK